MISRGEVTGRMRDVSDIALLDRTELTVATISPHCLYGGFSRGRKLIKVPCAEARQAVEGHI